VRKPTVEYTTEEYSKLMAINMCQLAHPLLKGIVFVSSVAGQTRFWSHLCSK